MPSFRGPFRPSTLHMRAVTVPGATFTGRVPLERALSRQLGSDASARLFIDEVLQDSGYDSVPEGRDVFQAFVREEVLPRLLPLVRLEQLHDLVRRTIGEEGSLHPTPLRGHGELQPLATTPVQRPRVVLVEPDSIKRVHLSRALVGARFDVEALVSPKLVAQVEAFHALVMALDADGETVANELAKKATRAGLVTYDEPSSKAAIQRVVRAWPNDRIAVIGRDAPSAMLCARVRVVTS